VIRCLWKDCGKKETTLDFAGRGTLRGIQMPQDLMRYSSLASHHLLL